MPLMMIACQFIQLLHLQMTTPPNLSLFIHKWNIFYNEFIQSQTNQSALPDDLNQNDDAVSADAITITANNPYANNDEQPSVPLPPMLLDDNTPESPSIFLQEWNFYDEFVNKPLYCAADPMARPFNNDDNIDNATVMNKPDSNITNNEQLHAPSIPMSLDDNSQDFSLVLTEWTLPLIHSTDASTPSTKKNTTALVPATIAAARNPPAGADPEQITFLHELEALHDKLTLLL